MKTKSLLHKFAKVNKATMALIAFSFISLLSINPLRAQIDVDFSLEDGVEICQGSTFSLDVLASGGSGVYIDYEWIDPDGVVLFDFGTSGILSSATPGSYSVTVIVTDDEGTSGIGTFNYTILPGPTVATISAMGPTSFCSGQSVTLVATAGAGFTYQWRRGAANIAGATSQTYEASVAGTYRVIITAVNGCSRTSNGVTVNVFANPTPVASNDGPICENGTVQFSASPDGLSSYLWSGPNGFSANEQNPSLTDVPLTSAGIYTVTVTDSNNCSGTATTTLVVDPNPEAPVSATVNRNDICADDTGNITLTATGGSGDNLVWYSSSCGGTQVGVGPNITIPRPAATTTYFARWETDSDCAASACVSVQVRIRPLPVISFANTPVSCFGGNNGASTANVTVGTAPFSYSWNTTPPQTTQTASNLAAGNYTVLVTDAFGCSNSAETTITEPPLLTVTIGNVNNVQCFGQSNGSAQAQPSGGTVPYSYAWSNGQTTPTAAGLAAGNYSVTVTDANGCTATGSVTITQPTQINITVTTQTQPSCFGGTNGTITVAASGGTPGYTYNWSNGQTGATASNLAAGNYTVTVTDANGCTRDLAINLGQPTLLEATIINSEDVDCHGQETGSATVQGTGGTLPYTYAWSNGQTGATAINLGAGSYTVTITDANGCTATASVTIVQNAPLIITATITDASCNGLADGAIQINVSGGTGAGTYTYLWSTGATTQNLTNIISGNYSVTVTDANGCFITENFFVDQPESILASETITPVSCHGGNNGAILVTATGGTTPYSYLWSTGSTSNQITGLTAGAYSLTITDANGCTAIQAYTVPQPDPISYNATVTNILCTGEANGSVTITNVQGGTPPFTYAWSNGSTTQNLTNVLAGSYTLTITDANGCTAIETFVITEPADGLNVVINTVDVGCWGEATGSAFAIVTGGTPFPGNTYQYLWSTGATTDFIQNVGAGTYSLTVTDANGCTSVATAVIEEPDSPLEANAGPSITICSAANEGFAVLGGTGLTPTAIGGSGPYTYLWTANPPDPSLAGQENLANPIVQPLVQTTYTVLITDINGCTETDSATITVHPTVIADAGGGDDNTIFLCSGGSVTLGGTPLGTGNTGYYQGNPNVDPNLFTYRWDRIAPTTGFVSNQPHPTVNPTVTTTYVVRVREIGGFNCIAYDTVTVVIVPALMVQAIADASVCNGNNTGVSFTLGATISGGTGDPANYSILWTANPADPSLAGQQNLLNPVVSPTQTTVYTITVTDTEGIACQASDDVTITVFPEIVVDAGTDTTICHPDNGGDFILGGSPTAQYIDGSAGSFTYSWTSDPAGFTSSEANPVVAPTQTTTYFLTVTDANGCQEFTQVIVTVLPPLVANAGTDQEMCHPSNGGEVQLNGSASGGTPGYTYLWEPAEGLSNPNIANPIASPSSTTIYTLTVTDAFGCQDTDQVQVSVTNEVVVEITGDDQMCHPADGGFVTLIANASGGTGAFLYQWSANPPYDFGGQQNNATITVNPTINTTFTVVVTDLGALACQAQSSFVVTVLDPLQIIFDTDTELCHPDNTTDPGTTITALVGGGSGDFTYLWSTGEDTQAIFVNPMASTTYSVTVTDNISGCTSEESILITVFDPLVADAGADATVCFMSSVQLNGSAFGGSGSGYTYSWFPTEGLSNPNIANPVYTTPSNLNEGETVVFTLTVTDANGCISTDQVTVEVLPEIILDAGDDREVCFGSEVMLGGDPTAQGGSGNYNYFWTIQPGGFQFSTSPNPVVTINFTGSREYRLLVHDLEGNCFRSADVTLTVIDEPIVTVTANPEQICEGAPSVLTATGGDSYLWSTGETTAQITVFPTETTTYSVTVTNICGSTTGEVTVVVAPGPVVDLGEDIEVCAGEIVVLDAGSFVNATYLWSDGSTEQTLVVTETGIYSVTVTSLDNFCSSEDQILVTFNPLPQALVGDDQIICLGEEVMIGVDDAGMPIPINTYLWISSPEDPSISDPTISNPMVSPTVTTTYTLIETYVETGCTNSNSVVVSVVGGLPNAGEDQQICQGESVTLGPDVPYPGNTYFWTSSNPDEVFENDIPNPVVSPSVTTTYTLVEEYTEFGCINTASVVITVLPSPQAFTGPDQDICLGEMVTLGTEYTEPMPPNTYLWTSEPLDESISDPNVSNPTVSPTVTTIYTLTEVFILTGCTTVNTVVVTVHPYPEAIVIDDTSVCQGESIQPGSAAQPGLSYYWTSEPQGFVSTDANPVIVPSQLPLDANNQITLILQVSNDFCTSEAQVVITVIPAPEPEVSDDLTFCNPQDAQDTPIGGEAIDGYIYQWQGSDGFSSSEANPLVSPTATTTYTLIVTDTQTGCSATVQVVITISDLSFVQTNNPRVCEDAQVAVLGQDVEVSGGTPPYTWFWTNAQGNNIGNQKEVVVNAPFSENYTLTVLDAAGCPISHTFQIEFIDNPQVSLLINNNPAGSVYTAYQGQTVIFEAIPNGYDRYDFYLLDAEETPNPPSEEDLKDMGTPAQSGLSNRFIVNDLKNGQRVFVVAFDGDCSGASDMVTILINELPNAFTPDGDGINDTFAEGLEITIFNRWGQKVYEGTSGWDGTFNGRKVSPGTYYYLVNIYDEFNNKTTMKGSVTVILTE